jgi:hypothetical protein
MARDYQASPAEIAHVTRVGVKTPLPNGDILHVGRHPSSPDHEIRVITRAGKVMQAKATLKPMQAVLLQKKQQEGAVKAKQDLSKSRQKEQLAKKRARTPKPKNK